MKPNEHELLERGLKETRAAMNIAEDLQRAVAQNSQGLPLSAVRQSVGAFRRHLQGAASAAMALEELAKE